MEELAQLSRSELERMYVTLCEKHSVLMNQHDRTLAELDALKAKNGDRPES